MKPRGTMKIPITIKIDHNKKQLFESTKQIHGLTFTDALDEVVTGYLSDIIPADLLKLEIQKTEDKLNGLRESLVKVNITQEQNKYDIKSTGGTSEQLTQFRDKKYEESEQAIKTQIKNHCISWKRIADLFMFKNKNEAQLWILDKIENVKNDK